MPAGQTRLQVLATESQPFRPTPLAYTFSSKVDLLLDVQKIQPKVLYGHDEIGWWGGLVLNDLGEALTNEVLDRLVRASPAMSKRDAVGERGTSGNEAAWVA